MCYARLCIDFKNFVPRKFSFQFHFPKFLCVYFWNLFESQRGWERVTQRVREIIHLLIHSQIGHNGWGCARWKSVLLLGLSHGCGDPNTWAILCCFASTSSGSWIKSGAAENQRVHIWIWDGDSVGDNITAKPQWRPSDLKKKILI